MVVVLLVLSSILLSGCAMTVNEFRGNPLTYLAQVHGKHISIANCILHGLEETVETWPDMFRVTTNGGRTSLLVSRSQPALVGLPISSPLTEFVLTQVTNTDVLIETRTRSYLAGNHFIDHAKPFIETCAQQSLTNGT